MRQIVRQAMLDGAVGVSTSLQYAPAPYASTDELIALASEAAATAASTPPTCAAKATTSTPRWTKHFASAAKLTFPIEIWHLKAAGKQNWGRMPEIVQRIENRSQRRHRCCSRHLRLHRLVQLVLGLHPAMGARRRRRQNGSPSKRPRNARQNPRRHLEQSAGWDNEWLEIPGPEAILIGVVYNPKLHPVPGQNDRRDRGIEHKDPLDTLLDLLAQDPSISVAVFGMSEQDVELALKQPWVSVDNDSEGTAPAGLLGQAHPHPRAYGTFPHILHKYVAEDHLLTLAGRHPQILGTARAAHALHRPRRAEAGHVGRYRCLRSRQSARPRDLLKSQSVLAGHGIRTGQRCPCHRARADDQRLPRQSITWGSLVR